MATQETRRSRTFYDLIYDILEGMVAIVFISAIFVLKHVGMWILDLLVLIPKMLGLSIKFTFRSKFKEANKPADEKSNDPGTAIVEDDRYTVADQILSVNFQDGFIAYVWVYAKAGRLVRMLKCVRQDLVEMLGRERFPMQELTYAGGPQELVRAMDATERDALTEIRRIMPAVTRGEPMPNAPTSSRKAAKQPAAKEEVQAESNTPASKQAPKEEAPRSKPGRDDFTGKVLDFGATKRQFKGKKNPSDSYFLRMMPEGEDDPVQRYGVVLEEQIAKHNVQIGDRIRLRLLGKEKIPSKVEGEKPHFRNVWEITKLS